jgi:hypothetical protein
MLPKLINPLESTGLINPLGSNVKTIKWISLFHLCNMCSIGLAAICFSAMTKGASLYTQSDFGNLLGWIRVCVGP